jgi:AraC-like DNA-binding protein
MSEVVLPPSVYRNESVYRTLHGRPAPVHGCGFIMKPAHAGGYQNRVMPQLLVGVYVLRGVGTFTDWNGRADRAAAGDMVIMPAGRRHGVQQDPDGQWAESYITIDGRFGATLLDLGVLPDDQFLLHPGLDLTLVQQFERILDDLSHLPDYALPSILCQVHELLNHAAMLHRKRTIPDRQQQIIESACVLLSQDLGKRIDVESVAARLDMSYERFRKLFRQRVGVSPGDYRIRRRIDRARALIWQHGLSNKQVAYELGYPDPFTFSKQFRKVTSMWPEEYRRSV